MHYTIFVSTYLKLIQNGKRLSDMMECMIMAKKIFAERIEEQKETEIYLVFSTFFGKINADNRKTANIE